MRNKMPKKLLKGIVISDKPNKTITVVVERKYQHPVLKKVIKAKKKYSVHDEENNFSVSEETPTKENYKTLYKTIKKVEEEIERYSFNTVVSTFMICVNELTEQKCKSREIISNFTVLLSSYAPHISEEIWHKLGNTTSVTIAAFPKFNESYLVEDEVNYPVSFNGKMRFKITLAAEMTKEQVEVEVMKHKKTAHYLDGKSPKKVIVVPKRIVNIVM